VSEVVVTNGLNAPYIPHKQSNSLLDTICHFDLYGQQNFF